MPEGCWLSSGSQLDPAQCRAQTYEGASNMAGVINGCAANFMKIVPEAHCYHFASHGLNLALSQACKVPELQNMMQTLAVIFKNSPKRQRRLELSTDQRQRKREGLKEVGAGKMKLLCETRWVEPHATLEEFREMYEPILDYPTAISNNDGNKWSSNTVTDSFVLLCAI